MKMIKYISWVGIYGAVKSDYINQVEYVANILAKKPQSRFRIVI